MERQKRREGGKTEPGVKAWGDRKQSTTSSAARKGKKTRRPKKTRGRCEKRKDAGGRQKAVRCQSPGQGRTSIVTSRKTIGKNGWFGPKKGNEQGAGKDPAPKKKKSCSTCSKEFKKR